MRQPEASISGVAPADVNADPNALREEIKKLEAEARDIGTKIRDSGYQSFLSHLSADYELDNREVKTVAVS